MFKFLDYYFFKEFNRVCGIIVILFFPFIFLADFVISGNFHFYTACSKILFRYGQMLPLILLIGSYLTTTNILHKNDRTMFLQLGCSKTTALKALGFSWLLYSLIYFFLIIPSNSLFFPSKLMEVKWTSIKIDDNTTIFVHKKDSNKYDMFSYQKNNSNVEKVIDNNLELKDDDFYITWNEVKKLSYSALKEYRQYLNKHKWDTTDIEKQECIYIYKFFLLLLMLICGYLFALKKSLFALFVLFLMSNWIDILAFYLTFKYCIFILCLNLLIWGLISFFYLFF